MQEIEAAVREYDAAAIALFAHSEQNEFVLRNDFSHRWCCGTGRVRCSCFAASLHIIMLPGAHDSEPPAASKNV